MGMNETKTLFLVLILFILISFSSNLPNIVIFLADDTGYGDLSSFGNPSQESGEIDQLSNTGLKFTSFYAADSFCTPARSALLTGRLPVRSGMVPPTGIDDRVLEPDSKGGLPRDEITIADGLKSAGYRTAIVGKWHQGINSINSTDGTYLPQHYGFDFVRSLLPFTNHWNCDETGRYEENGPDSKKCFLYRNNKIWQQPLHHPPLAEYFVNDSIHFIEESVQAGDPFFLYHAHAHQHVSLFTGSRFVNSSVRGEYGSNLREMDWEVGEIVKKIKELGIERSTLVIWTSDHGPHIELCLDGGSAGMLRGGKGYSSWEGGLRVPGIAWWPGTIKAGSVYVHPVSSMDLLPTAFDLAGVPLPSDRIIDGVSLVPLLKAKNPADVPDPHQFLFHYCADRLMAVRHKEFKVVYHQQTLPFDNFTQVDCHHGVPDGEIFECSECYGNKVHSFDPPLLYNVMSDPGERWTLDSTTPEHAKIVKEVELAVVDHCKHLKPKKPQLGFYNSSLQPCCNPPHCRCNYPS